MESAFIPLLGIVKERAALDAVCILQADLWRGTIRPVASAGCPDAASVYEDVDLTGEMIEQVIAGHYDSLDPLLPLSWADFPRRLSLALHYRSSFVGLLFASQRRDQSWTVAQRAFLELIRPSVASALAATMLHRDLTEMRRERDELRQKLLDRKLVERAKGILQARGAMTEEQAYLELRKMSRQRRSTMGEMAARIVEQPNLAVAVRRMSA